MSEIFPASPVGAPLVWRLPGNIRPAVRRITSEILRVITDGRVAGEAGPGQFALLAGGNLGPEATTAMVWGGGLANQNETIPEVTPERVLGVRGMLTADRMVAAGIRLRDVPLGDPGLLAARVLDSVPALDAVPIAVVPGKSGHRHPFFIALRNSREARLVDLDRDSLTPLREIAAAEVVVAQDLNGLVYAEALGKRAVWVADRSDDDHDFPFHDWFSTTWEKQERPVVLGGSADKLATMAIRAHHARPPQRLADALTSLMTQV